MSNTPHGHDTAVLDAAAVACFCNTASYFSPVASWAVFTSSVAAHLPTCHRNAYTASFLATTSSVASSPLLLSSLSSSPPLHASHPPLGMPADLNQTPAAKTMVPTIGAIGEPYYLLHFDINPHTSIFSTVFCTALVLQVAGFYLFRAQLTSRLSNNSNNSHTNTGIGTNNSSNSSSDGSGSREDDNRTLKPSPPLERRLSWVLTLFSSLVLVTGMYTLSTYIQWFPQDEDQRSLVPPLSFRHVPRESPAATFYAAYFTSYLMCDLVLGWRYYRQYLDPLSGWAHHLFYLGVVSAASKQQHLGILFALGTPVEASSIFLSLGHIFPELRNDSIFAATFFVVRVLYPLLVLPDLVLNSESRMMWKVATVALLVHVYWFYRFIQQQLRYHKARQSKRLQVQEQQSPEQALCPSCLDSAPVMTLLPNDTKVVKELQQDEKEPKSVMEEFPVVKARSSLRGGKVFGSIRPKAFFLEKPLLEVNEVSGAEVSIMNGFEVNTSRSRSRRKASSSSSSSSYRPLSEIFVTGPEDHISESNQNVNADKSMEELLDEQAAEIRQSKQQSNQEPVESLFESEEEEAAVRALLGFRDPSRNKTFSAMAMKRLASSQSNSRGAMRLSRPSSMRDSRKRIGLDAISFECPVPKLEASTTKGPAQVAITEEVFESDKVCVGDATVVFRAKKPARSMRMSLPMVMSESARATEEMAQDEPRSTRSKSKVLDFETIRVPRGVSVNA